MPGLIVICVNTEILKLFHVKLISDIYLSRFTENIELFLASFVLKLFACYILKHKFLGTFSNYCRYLFELNQNMNKSVKMTLVIICVILDN